MPEPSSARAPAAAPRPAGWRYRAGWIFFILSFVLPLVGLGVPFLGFDKATTVLLTGVLLAGGPEVAIVIAVALWGRETFNYFMGRTKGLLRKLAPATYVSPGRYRLGLVLFVGSFFPSWVFAYAPHWISDAARIPVLAAADLVFILSFFVLGGEFWARVRALFTPPVPSLDKVGPRQ